MWAASWFHDGAAPGPAKTGYGNNWVVAAVVVRLPALSRPVAIPVLAKLVIKDTSSASRLWLARRMAEAIAGVLPGRAIHVVADSAYAGGELKKLPSRVTWTTRLRKDAALYELPPARHRKARPSQGERRQAPLPRHARRHRGVHPGHRHPLRQDHRHPVGCQKSAWPVSCGDDRGQLYGIMIIRVLAPSLSHLPSGCAAGWSCSAGHQPPRIEPQVKTSGRVLEPHRSPPMSWPGLRTTAWKLVLRPVATCCFPGHSRFAGCLATA